MVGIIAAKWEGGRDVEVMGCGGDGLKLPLCHLTALKFVGTKNADTSS
jgi:hypothetical protein